MRSKNILKFGVTTFVLGSLLTAASIGTPKKVGSAEQGFQANSDVAFSVALMNWQIRSNGGVILNQNTSIAQFNNIDGVDNLNTGTVNSSFFRTSAVPFSNLGSQKDWDRVRTAKFDDKKTYCKTSVCNRRVHRAFNTVGSLENKTFYEKLQTINQFVNTNISYSSDQKVYSKKDFWAPAKKTLELGRGDCEDFAILKHALLLKAGIPASSLSLVILKDTSRRLYHAVLAVSTNKGHLILDNVAQNVYRDTSINYYQPMFSFSMDRSWIHGVDKGSSNLLAQNTTKYGDIAPGESSINESILPIIESKWIEGLRPTLSYSSAGPANWRY